MSDISGGFFSYAYKVIDRKIKNEKINCMLKKLVSREVMLYLACGLMTTVVNFVCYYLLYNAAVKMNFFSDKTCVHISNVTAWIISVTFAFVTNKLLVFESKSFEKGVVLKEAVSFMAARLFSLGVEEGGLFILNTIFSFNAIMVKIVMAVFVVILNYVFSKRMIFKNKK